jgi:hypothetical protein
MSFPLVDCGIGVLELIGFSIGYWVFKNKKEVEHANLHDTHYFSFYFPYNFFIESKPNLNVSLSHNKWQI